MNEVAYHRLGRTGAHGWWRTPLSLLVAVLVTAGLLVAYGLILWDPLGVAIIGDSDGQLVLELALLLGAGALFIPAVIAAVHAVERRPPGTLASVSGRLRWDILGFGLKLCGAVAVVAVVAATLIDPPARPDWGLVLGAVAVSIVLVPLQAAGEEYVFRGYLPQLAGRWLANPWLPAALFSVLFAFLHGTDQETIEFADRLVFGLVAAWVTLRTGGLEGAIAIHTAGNIAALALVTLSGELDVFLVWGDEPDPDVLAGIVDVALVAVLGLVLVRRYAR